MLLLHDILMQIQMLALREHWLHLIDRRVLKNYNPWAAMCFTLKTMNSEKTVSKAFNSVSHAGRKQYDRFPVERV